MCSKHFKKANSQKQSLGKGKHFRFAKVNSCNNYFIQGSSFLKAFRKVIYLHFRLLLSSSTFFSISTQCLSQLYQLLVLNHKLSLAFLSSFLDRFHQLLSKNISQNPHLTIQLAVSSRFSFSHNP